MIQELHRWTKTTNGSFFVRIPVLDLDTTRGVSYPFIRFDKKKTKCKSEKMYMSNLELDFTRSMVL